MTMVRVLDTAALLHWPPAKLAEGVCAPSQRHELERLSPSRMLLVEALDLTWQDVPAAWLDAAKEAASTTGDLPRLSDVDLDVLALAMGLEAVMVTDDYYRLQNTFKHAGGTIESVAHAPSKKGWIWELRCTGCRDVQPVPEGVDRRKKGPAGECRRCGSPMLVKRRRG